MKKMFLALGTAAAIGVTIPSGIAYAGDHHHQYQCEVTGTPVTYVRTWYENGRPYGLKVEFVGGGVLVGVHGYVVSQCGVNVFVQSDPCGHVCED